MMMKDNKLDINNYVQALEMRVNLIPEEMLSDFDSLPPTIACWIKGTSLYISDILICWLRSDTHGIE